MNRPAKNSRLTFLVIGMALLAAAILWSAFASWRAGRDVRARFERVRVEGARTTSRLRDGILEMRSLLAMYEVTDDPTYWETFQDRSEQLRMWLASAKENSTTAEERDVFAKIDAAYRDYLKVAQAIKDSHPKTENKAELTNRMIAIESASKPLLDLGVDLATTRRTALTEFVNESEKSIGRLQQFIFGSLLALVVFGTWSVRMVYRETIAPLRVRLIETRELAERQQKLASLGVLAAGVAHEIRNPLTAIKARLYTQQKALPPGSPAHNDAAFIGKEIDRLAKIISEFLAFARPADPILASTAAAGLLGDVKELLAPQLASQSIQIAVDAPAGLTILADSHQLQQVLINLVQNAAESIGNQGTIHLRAHAEERSLAGHFQKVVVLEVEDNGKGIPADIQDRLFDPFFTTKPTGTGLGLSIAARIVEKHGGAIQYQTRVDRGTTFGIILPEKTAE